jgi:peroxiredoxin
MRKLAMELRRGKRLAATVLFLLGATMCSFGQQADTASARALDLNGREVQPLRDTKYKAIVFFFVETNCPISNRYAPEIKRLFGKFASAGITFWLIYPDSDDAPPAVRGHLKDYGYELGALRDVRQELVKAAGVIVTPEAAILVPSAKGPQVVYHGRIDDRVAAFGKTRATPTKRDVEQVLAAILSGKRVTPSSSFAFGCSIEAVK